MGTIKLQAVLLWGGLAWLLLPASLEPTAGSRASLVNLDLPYSARSADEDEEAAPDLFLFYGEAYSAEAVVFCLDESLTMEGDRFQTQKKETIRAIQELSPGTHFNVITYGGEVSSFRHRLVKATKGNKAAATGFINSRVVTLGTCLGPGVVKALKMLRTVEASHKAVIVLSDGTATRCPYEPLGCEERESVASEIRSQIQVQNPGSRIRVHSILIGDAASCDGLPTLFMKQLAAANRGTFRQLTQ